MMMRSGPVNSGDSLVTFLKISSGQILTDFPGGAQPKIMTVAPLLVQPIACSRAGGKPEHSTMMSKPNCSQSTAAMAEARVEGSVISKPVSG